MIIDTSTGIVPKRRIDCRNCGGEGLRQDGTECPACDGTGKERRSPLPKLRTYCHSIRRATNPFDRNDDRYVISWHQRPVRQQVRDAIHMRTVDRAAALRFAKKWGVSMPKEDTSHEG